MKVIHNATKQKWTKLVTCRHCESQLEVEAADVHYDFYATRGTYWFYCGACGVAQHFPADLMPGGSRR